MKIAILALSLFQVSCKVSLLSVDTSFGKSPIESIKSHTYEKEKKEKEVLTDDKINNWLKEEFKNITNNPYPT